MHPEVLILFCPKLCQTCHRCLSTLSQVETVCRHDNDLLQFPALLEVDCGITFEFLATEQFLELITTIHFSLWRRRRVRTRGVSNRPPPLEGRRCFFNFLFSFKMNFFVGFCWIFIPEKAPICSPVAGLNFGHSGLVPCSIFPKISSTLLIDPNSQFQFMQVV